MNTTLMRWFGLSAPILQAPIGSAATPALVRAVAAGGGMGSFGMTFTPPETGLAQARDLAGDGVPFFINFVLRFGTERPRLFLESGAKAVSLSWGLDAALIHDFKSAGFRVGVQVGSAEGARRAVEAGADFVIAQGMEAGGHVQSTTPLSMLLPDAITAANGAPVVAAGGLADAADVARVIAMGASAAMLGTRFVAAQESSAHAAHKAAITAARDGDVAFTNCFDIDWPYAMHGVIRNSTFRAWEAEGQPAAPHRPGEGDVIGHHGETPVIRYSDTPPSEGMTGDAEAACLYAGTGAARISSVLPADEIVRSLWPQARVRS